MKLFVILRALAVRGRRPGAFAGGYRPLGAGEGTCAFTREDAVLVVVPVRDWQGAALELPPELAGAWRDVLTGALRELRRRCPVAELTTPYGLALLERV
jgi:maltooligosyltrehalose synthase